MKAPDIESRFLRLLAQLEANTISPDLAEWLHSGIAAHLYDGKRIDEALGILSHGQQTLDRQIRMMARNRNLRLAAESLGAMPNWRKAHILSTAVKRGYRHSNPRVKAALRRARACGELPETQRQLFTLIKS